MARYAKQKGCPPPPRPRPARARVAWYARCSPRSVNTRHRRGVRVDGLETAADAEIWTFPTHATIAIYLFLAKTISERLCTLTQNRRLMSHICFTILAVYSGHGGFFIRDKTGLFFSKSVFGRRLQLPNRGNLRKKNDGWSKPLSQARVLRTLPQPPQPLTIPNPNHIKTDSTTS